MSLRYLAASSSGIRKSTKKSPLSPLKRPKPEKRPSKEPDEEPLEVLTRNQPLLFINTDSILEAIDFVLENQWAESSVLHDHHHSVAAKRTKTQEELLFSLRGLAMETKAGIIQYRKQQLPREGMITLNQLYTMFQHKGSTFVDRELEQLTRSGTVRRFVISNALPVISRSGTLGQFQNVTYGYENVEVIVKSSAYSKLTEGHAKFAALLAANPSALYVTSGDLSPSELSELVKEGLLTLTSNHHNELEAHYSIAYPKCGTFLKMVNAGRRWLVKTLQRTRYKEALEQALFDKWHGKNMANFRAPFYGYDLMWVLSDALGAGVVETLHTPVGRGWRLTGKL